MFSFKPAWWLATVAPLTSAAACAQAIAPATPGGAEASATPTVTYGSPLQGYQPFRDEKIQSWKEANDTVGRIGGWRAYAKEAADSTPRPEAPPASGSAQNPHAGHGRH